MFAGPTCATKLGTQRSINQLRFCKGIRRLDGPMAQPAFVGFLNPDTRVPAAIFYGNSNNYAAQLVLPPALLCTLNLVEAGYRSPYA